MGNLLVFVFALALALVLAAATGLLVAFPVKWLWNYAAVDVLHMYPLDFWHAWALSWLCTLLFKTSVSSDSKDSKD